ncbi:MAG: TfoX/Sxy family protein [Pseudomonadota bacterium]
MENIDRTRLRNLGPKSWQMLEAAGIDSVEQLFRMGSIAAYADVKKAGCKPGLNLLWAIEGALTERDWKDIAKNERVSLLMQLDDVERDASRKSR